MNEVTTQDPNLSPRHAGHIVRRRVEELGLTVSDVADRLGMSRAMLNNLLEGSSSVTPASALKIERVLGTSAQLLLRIDSHYRLVETVERRREEEHELVDWADQFPREWMLQTAASLLDMNLDWDADPPGSTLTYFGVDSREAFEDLTPTALPRVTHHADRDPFALRAWLRAGEVRARHSRLPDYDRSRFKTVVDRLPQLTTHHTSVAACFQEMQNRFAQAGVYTTMVPEPANTKLNGASFWVSPRKPLIMVTGRLRRADVLWFTLAHEAMHVLHHTKSAEYISLDTTSRATNVPTKEAPPSGVSKEDYLSGGVPDADKPEEADADYRAANLLIGPDVERELLAGPPTQARVTELASRFQVHPEVLVGRLLHIGRAEYKWKWVHKHLRKFDPDALARQSPE